MLTKVCFLIMLQMTLLISSTFAEGLTIIMPPQVSIEGAMMTLGQVADISGDDELLVEKLRQFKLGSAPVPGSSVVLTKELLVMRLASLGSAVSGIVWQMPETVTVTTRFQTIKGQVLLDKAIGAAEERAGRSISSGEISIAPTGIGNVQDVVIPVGNIEITSDVPYGIHYNTPTTITVIVSVNGKVVHKINLRLDVKLYQQVVVSASSISLGEILTADKLRYERMDTGRMGSGYFTDVSKVLGLMTRRALTPGMVVTEAMVNKPSLIKRGNIVTIIARMGGMEVTGSGQAMQDGSEGQLIRVQNISSTKIVSAKVLDASTVQVLTYKSNGV